MMKSKQIGAFCFKEELLFYKQFSLNWSDFLLTSKFFHLSNFTIFARILTSHPLYWLSNYLTLLLINWLILYRFSRFLSCEMALFCHFWFTNSNRYFWSQVNIWSFFRILAKSLNVCPLGNFVRIQFIMQIVHLLGLFLLIIWQKYFWRGLVYFFTWTIFGWL